MAQASTQIFSFDCFIDTRGSNSNSASSASNSDASNTSSNSGFRIYYQKLIMMAVLPILILILCQIFWAMHHKFMKINQSPKNKIMSTVVILLFLVHPTIVQYMFSDFNCVDIDGDKRIQNDL